MSIVRRATLLLLAFAMAAPVAADEPRNAATWYRRAYSALGTITDADWEILWAWHDPHAAPSPAVRAVLERAQPIFAHMRRGSEQAYASYDLDYSQGFEMQLPHLGSARQVTKLLGFEAKRQLYDGDAHAAAEVVATMYRMAGHLESDRTLISSLVAFAIFKHAEGTAQVGYDRAAFDEAGAVAMLDAVHGLDANDPFGIIEATVGEQEFIVDWVTHRFATAADRQTALGEMEWLEPGLPDQLRFSAMTDEDFAAEVDQYDRMMGQVVEAFMIEDETVARATLEAIAAEVGTGGHGMLARLLATHPVRVYDGAVDARTAVRERRVMLEELVRGVRNPADGANAAFDYAAAIALLRAVPAIEFETVAAYAAGSTPIASDVGATLEKLGAAVEHLRRGSRRGRCDLSALRPGHRPRLVPEYVAGLQAALVLLHADWRRHHDAGDLGQAGERLAIATGVIGHLSQDEPLASALVAHAALGPVTRALRTEDAALDAVREAVLRLPRSDPFGYIASLVAARDDLAHRIRVPLPYDAERAALVARIDQTVRGWGPEHVLAAVIVYDTMARAGEPASTEPLDAVTARRTLPSLIPPDALTAARDRAPVCAPTLARGSAEIWSEAAPPTVVDLARRMTEARTDLRRAVQAARGPDRLARPAATPVPGG